MEQNDPSSSGDSSPAPQSFLRRHRVAIFIVLGILVFILGLVRFVHFRQKQHQEQAQIARAGRFRPRPGEQGQANAVAVSVATVASGEITVRIPALGTITPLATVTVKTQISGQLQKIFFKEGQLVKEGELLALIDPRPYEAALAQQEGNLRRDQSLLADARLNLKRYEDLITEDSVAQQQVDTQRALVDQYVGTVASDQAQIKTARINLAYCHITAPVNGRVGLRQVDQGNYVTPGDTNGIVVITELQPITAIFPIPEDNVTKVMQRMHDGATLIAEAYDRTNSAKLADGKVLTLDNQIDLSTGTVKLRALFDNKDNTLFPNQFVNIQLVLDTLTNQTVMPNAAVHRGAPNGVTTTFVYLVNQDNTVSVRPVTLGMADGERVAVTAGLTPGAVVVTEGGDRLRDGATVQLPGTDNTTRTAGSPGVPPSADASSPQQPNSAQQSNAAQQQQPAGAQQRSGKWHNRHKGSSQGRRQNPPPQ